MVRLDVVMGNLVKCSPRLFCHLTFSGTLELLAFLFVLLSFLTTLSQVIKKENFGIIN